MSNYAKGTTRIIKGVVLVKWSKNWWSAWDGHNRIWAETALKAYRGVTP